MDDPLDRWSQLIRRPGTVRLHGHFSTSIPPEGAGFDESSSRPALRLMVAPVATARPVHLIDITSTAVQAMLEGFLQTGVATGKLLSWETRGFGPRRRDTVRIRSRLP
jgi:hypothetical protein